MRTTTLGLAALAALAAPALAQFTIDWHTMDAGGATISGATLELGVTIGQPDATDTLSGATLDLTGGFWAAIAAAGCTGDINGDGVTDVFDFTLFTGTFGQAVPPFTGGDLDGSGFVDVLDFSIFASAFGCPN